jgi:hypothetical protein
MYRRNLREGRGSEILVESEEELEVRSEQRESVVKLRELGEKSEWGEQRQRRAEDPDIHGPSYARAAGAWSYRRELAAQMSHSRFWRPKLP